MNDFNTIYYKFHNRRLAGKVAGVAKKKLS